MAGYEVTTATDGQEALKAVEEAGKDREPNLILLDAMMPNMSGIEVLEKLRDIGLEDPGSDHLRAP